MIAHPIILPALHSVEASGSHTTAPFERLSNFNFFFFFFSDSACLESLRHISETCTSLTYPAINTDVNQARVEISSQTCTIYMVSHPLFIELSDIHGLRIVHDLVPMQRKISFALYNIDSKRLGILHVTPSLCWRRLVLWEKQELCTNVRENFQNIQNPQSEISRTHNHQIMKDMIRCQDIHSPQ